MNLRKILKVVFRPELSSVFALIMIVAAFAVADHFFGHGKFLSLRNIRVVTNSAALIAVPALGMTLVIIAAGIDLSAGTAVTLCGTVLVTILKFSEVAAGEPGFATQMMIALSAMVLTGCVCGFVNGLLISATKVVPFIVTLGTMTIFLGLGQILANESTVYADRENIPEWLRTFCYTGSNEDNLWTFGFLPGMPSSVLLAIGLAVLVGLMLRYTVFGRNIFAIGSSDSTARLCGINVPVTTVAIYTLAGFFFALGGLLYFAEVKNGNPNDGMGKELEIIAAVVLGGGSLSGGRGSVLGTIIGALIIGTISSACIQLSIPNTYTHIMIGCIIILAVIVDQLRHGSPEWFFRLISKPS